MKNTIGILLVTAILSSGIVAILFLKTGNPETHSFGFSRNYILGNAVLPLDTIDLGFDSYYIAGEASHTIYLGNVTAPRHVIAVTETLDTQQITLEVDNRDRFKFTSLSLRVDSPAFYLTDGTVPVIFYGSLDNRHAYPLHGSGSAFFLNAEPMENQSFALRSIGTDKKVRLGKLSIPDSSISFSDNLLEAGVDNFFSTDGILRYEPRTGKLIFMYHYRNQYLVMDRAMNLLAKGHTIDTISVPQIEVATLASSNAVTFASPPLMVNNQVALDENRLFIHSVLRADNDPPEEFSSHATIDVYNLDSSAYRYSFKIRKPEGENIRHFTILRNNLIVLFKRRMVLYDLSQITGESG